MKKRLAIIPMIVLAFVLSFTISIQTDASQKRTKTLDLSSANPDNQEYFNVAEGWSFESDRDGYLLTLDNVDIKADDEERGIILPETSKDITILLKGRNHVSGYPFAIGVPSYDDDYHGNIIVKGYDTNATLTLDDCRSAFWCRGDITLSDAKFSFYCNWVFSYLANITLDNVAITAKTNWSPFSGEDALITAYNNEKSPCSIKMKDCYIEEGGYIVKESDYLSYIGTKTAPATDIVINRGLTPSVEEASITDIKRDYNKIRLEWRIPRYCDGVYEIYRSTSRNDGFEKIATTNTESYTDKGLSFNKNYYYRIVCKNSISESYSDVVKAKTSLAVVSGTKLKRGSTSDTLKWEKSSGANGYVICRATSKGGKYSKVKTITKGTKLSVTLKRPKRGKRYYYKIKARRKVGKKYYFSSSKRF